MAERRIILPVNKEDDSPSSRHAARATLCARGVLGEKRGGNKDGGGGGGGDGGADGSNRHGPLLPH